MKAAPLLRAWVHRLREHGVATHARHRWTGWDAAGRLRLDTPHGEATHESAAVILALGGGSWARLGSDGAWEAAIDGTRRAGRTAEAVELWLRGCVVRLLRAKFAGEPLKNVVASCVAADGAPCAVAANS